MDLLVVEPLEVDGDACARDRRLDRLAVALEAADLRLACAGLEDHRLAQLAGPAGPGARHDRAEAVLHEAAVDEEACRPRVVCAVRRAADQLEQGLAHALDARSRLGARGEDRHLGQGPAGQRVAHLLGRELDHLFVDEVRLRQDDQTTVDAEQLADGEMLLRLGHHAFVRSHDEHHQVESAGPRHHRAHEAFVTRHVDHGDAGAVGQLEGGEAQLDRDAPGLLLGQAVEVAAREGVDEGGLAVVDMAGGAEDDIRRPGCGLGGVGGIARGIRGHARAQRGPIRSVPI